MREFLIEGDEEAVGIALERRIVELHDAVRVKEREIASPSAI
jgi:hypothetical protein